MLHSLSFVGIAQGVIPVVLTVTSIGAWGPKFAMREDASLQSAKRSGGAGWKTYR
jgi:hypothetical protein